MSLQHSFHDAFKENLQLPSAFQRQVDATIAWLIDLEKEGYSESSILPFSQQATKMKIRGQEVFVEIYTQWNQAIDLLKKHFAIQEKRDQEKRNQTFAQDASFEAWNEATQKMYRALQEADEGTPFASSLIDLTRPFQEQLGLSWAFMTRAYEVAEELFAEKSYEESLVLYRFLRRLNPLVFEYWLREGDCEQILGQPEKAIENYVRALLLQPKNPTAFFHLASCYFGLQEKECCREALEVCIEYGKHDPGYTELLKNAEQIKQILAA